MTIWFATNWFKLNYSYSIRIRPNSSVNYSYSAEYYTPTIRYSPNRDEPNLQDVPTQTGEIVMYICCIGLSFIGRLILSNAVPFLGGKNLKICNGA